MRFLSIVTAVLVTGTLYLMVMERDLIAGLSGATSGPGAEAVTTQVAEPEAANTGAQATQAEATGAVSVLARNSLAQSVDNAVVLRGRTEATRSVEMRAETSGRVISEPLRRGAHVNEGDVLCRIDPATRPQTLAEAQTRLAEAELNARNAERLTEGGFAAETRKLAAQSALQSATSAVEGARRELERLEIRAPFKGLLEADTAELGTLLQPGALCARLIQLDPILLVGYVPETDVNRIEIGAMAGGRLSDGREMVGRVTFLARSADPMTRTFRTEITVPNPDLAIRDGQTVDMLVATDGVSAHLLPGSAMTLDDGGRIGVRIVDADSRARFAPLRVLRDTPEGLWVSGLPDEVLVIVRGQEYVIDGVVVDVTMQEPAQ